MEDLMKILRVSSSAMRAQGTRLRVISENIANSGSLPQKPGQMPFRRKVVTFRNVMDRNIGLNTVRVDRIRPDKSDFLKSYDPNHPAADADGYVLKPNINTLVEMMDMREAQRSYEANVNVIKSTKAMLQSTIDLLR